MKKIIKFLSGRLFITCVLILFQIMAYFLLFYRISEYSQYIYGFMTFLSLFFAFKIATGNSEPDFKVIWVFFLISVPIFSWILYLLIRKKSPFSKGRKISRKTAKNISPDTFVNQIDDKDIKKQLKYIVSSTETEIYSHTKTVFFPMGEDFSEVLKTSLKKQKNSYFLNTTLSTKEKYGTEYTKYLKEKPKKALK